jgi:hypothetical protein
MFSDRFPTNDFPSLPSCYKCELERTHASCTLPGQPITMFREKIIAVNYRLHHNTLIPLSVYIVCMVFSWSYNRYMCSVYSPTAHWKAPQHIWKPHLSLYTLTIASSSSALGKNTNDDFILSMITWKTSLTQIQTNNGETLNKFAIVRYSAVLAR